MTVTKGGVFHRHWLVLLVALVISSNLFASSKFQKLDDRAPDEFANVQVSGDLSVAVETIRDKDSIKAFFGKDLISAGLLPVRVIIESKSSDQGYLVLYEQIRFATGDKVDQIVEAGREGRSTRGANRLGAVSSLLISIPGMLASGAWYVRADKIDHAMKMNRFQSRAITPGRNRAAGVFFVPITKKARNEAVAVSVTVTEAKSGEPHEFLFVQND